MWHCRGSDRSNTGRVDAFGMCFGRIGADRAHGPVSGAVVENANNINATRRFGFLLFADSSIPTFYLAKQYKIFPALIFILRIVDGVI